MTNFQAVQCEQTMRALRQAALVVNSKWKLPLLVALLTGTRHFRGLERSVAGISTKLLAKELKELEAQHLLARTVYPGPPSWWNTKPCRTRSRSTPSLRC
jgi:DNA-binding HxlR family transcriptional regulator